jgi:hypothetical protein
MITALRKIVIDEQQYLLGISLSYCFHFSNSSEWVNDIVPDETFYTVIVLTDLVMRGAEVEADSRKGLLLAWFLVNANQSIDSPDSPRLPVSQVPRAPQKGTLPLPLRRSSPTESIVSIPEPLSAPVSTGSFNQLTR